jgi:hypothetical protein
LRPDASFPSSKNTADRISISGEDKNMAKQQRGIYQMLISLPSSITINPKMLPKHTKSGVSALKEGIAQYIKGGLTYQQANPHIHTLPINLTIS